MRNLGSGRLFAALALAVVSSVGWAQTSKPTVVPYPLEFDPNPAVKRSEDALRAAWTEHLRDRAGVIVPLRKEVEAALRETRRQDCRESNECLAQLALKAGTLYGIYANLEYTVKKQLVLVGRVVRDDGKLMATGRVELPRGKDTLVEVFKVLLTRLLDRLALKDLPTFKEVPKVELPPERPPEPPVVVVTPPPLPPPEQVANPWRTAGYVGGGAGVAALAAGVVLFATAPAFKADGSGNVLPGDQATALASYRQKSWGVGLMIAGGALAVAGAVTWAATPETTTRVALVPLAGGGAVMVGGTFQ